VPPIMTIFIANLQVRSSQDGCAASRQARFTEVLALRSATPKDRVSQGKDSTGRAVSPAVSDGEHFSETGAASRP
jgi:hypothetical protein